MTKASITHFTFIHHHDCGDVLLRDMCRIASRNNDGNSWNLWARGEVRGAVNSRSGGSFLIGHAHENGDGLYAKMNLDERYFSCRSDVISGIPVFVCQQEEGVVISSSLDILIQACRQLKLPLELDMTACSEMMLASYVFTRGRTLLKDVWRLLPNHELRVDLSTGKVISVRTKRDFVYADNPESWSWSVQHLKKGIVSGLKRYAGKRVAVMLSGGADSRLAAVCAVAAGLEPDFFTFGQSTVNASDFSVASVVAHQLGRPLRAFSATAYYFLNNWKNIAKKSNWTDMWNLAKLPWDFYEAMSEYDVVLRGDGDGIYGWKGAAGNISDILHQMEISPMAAALKCAGWFEEPREVFGAGEESRDHLIAEYANNQVSLINLKNVLYQRHREYGSIAQNIWLLSNWLTCDAPLLWDRCIDVASKIPKNRRISKQVIFAVLDTFESVRNVPFSSGGSWNDRLENLFSGVSEELIDYVIRWSPWPVHKGKLRAVYESPPPVPQVPRPSLNPLPVIKSRLQQNRWIRRYVLECHPEWVHSSFCDRGLTRLAVVSNLCETLNKNPNIKIINLGSVYE